MPTYIHEEYMNLTWGMDMLFLGEQKEPSV